MKRVLRIGLLLAAYHGVVFGSVSAQDKKPKDASLRVKQTQKAQKAQKGRQSGGQKSKRSSKPPKKSADVPDLVSPKDAVDIADNADDKTDKDGEGKQRHGFGLWLGYARLWGINGVYYTREITPRLWIDAGIALTSNDAAYGSLPEETSENDDYYAFYHQYNSLNTRAFYYIWKNEGAFLAADLGGHRHVVNYEEIYEGEESAYNFDGFGMSLSGSVGYRWEVKGGFFTQISYSYLSSYSLLLRTGGDELKDGEFSSFARGLRFFRLHIPNSLRALPGYLFYYLSLEFGFFL